MKLTYRQTQAIDILEDTSTNELIFGGGVAGGKSFIGCYWILKLCIRYPGVRCLIGRKKLKTLKDTTLKTFYDVCRKMDIRSGEHYTLNSQTNTITFFNGSEILLKDLFNYPADPDFDELGSLEITAAFIDECNQVVEKGWNIVKSRIRYKLDEYNLIPKILGTCNPTKNWVYREFYKPNKEGELADNKKFIQSLIKDNPHTSKEYIKNLEGLPSAQKERLVHGNWETDNDPTSLINYDNILSIFDNTFVSSEDATKYITCDVARLGSDKAVIIVWSGLEVIELYEYPLSRINELQRVITSLSSKHKIPIRNIVVDEDGVGGGLVDNLKCKGFVNNSKPLEGENYTNLKSQCYYKLAEYIMEDKIYISADLTTDQKENIIQDLEQVKADNIDFEGKMKIISKAKVKEYIGRSPDYSDALMMRMYFEVQPPKRRHKFR